MPMLWCLFGFEIEMIEEGLKRWVCVYVVSTCL